MTDLKYLTYEGMSVRTYNALMRHGIKTVEDLLGTHPYGMTLAEGPEPWEEELPGKHIKGKLTWVKSGPGGDTWYAYRYRYPWSDTPSVGVKSIVEIQDALASWKTRC
jgi:hypothetical protein